MKYIKTFEAQKNFEIGDIVLFKDRFATDLIDDGSKWDWQTPKMVGKIVRYDKFSSRYIILVETSEYKNDEKWVPISRIMRLANPKELEEYNLTIAIKKYNL